MLAIMGGMEQPPNTSSQEWRACGHDGTGVPDCDPWRDNLESAQHDLTFFSPLAPTAMYPYDDAWIEIRTISQPKRVVPVQETCEQKRAREYGIDPIAEPDPTSYNAHTIEGRA